VITYATILQRCMECPIAYHVTCIPPTARFHELATLCHEHAGAFKLPELDLNDSIQSQIEKKIDEKFHQRIEKIESRQKRDRKKGKNLFFAGLSGEVITAAESNILSLMRKDKGCIGSSCVTKDQLWFCLPCDIKKEVHAKPPNYRHVHSLQYLPSNRPPKIPPADDVCQCVFACDEDCINRMLYTECFGDTANPTGSARDSNCAVGPSCSNRQLGQRAGAKCKPQREQGKGWGLVTLNSVKRGDLVQEYVGEVVDEATKVKRLNEWYQEHPNDPNFYLMALQPGWFIDARDVANLSRFINHSCDPNCVLQQINVNGRMRCGIFALRDIQPNEFLSYDYHFDTKHGDRFICCCGSKNCRGTMKYGKMEDNANNMNKTKLWEAAKASFERDKKFLLDYEEDCRQRSSQVGVMLPGADCHDEYVANGAQEKHRVHGQRHRLFLWRNVELGNDMAARLMKLEGVKS
jgi:SET domain